MTLFRKSSRLHVSSERSRRKTRWWRAYERMSEVHCADWCAHVCSFGCFLVHGGDQLGGGGERRGAGVREERRERVERRKGEARGGDELGEGQSWCRVPSSRAWCWLHSSGNEKQKRQKLNSRRSNRVTCFLPQKGSPSAQRCVFLFLFTLQGKIPPCPVPCLQRRVVIVFPPPRAERRSLSSTSRVEARTPLLRLTPFVVLLVVSTTFHRVVPGVLPGHFPLLAVGLGLLDDLLHATPRAKLRRGEEAVTFDQLVEGGNRRREFDGGVVGTRWGRGRKGEGDGGASFREGFVSSHGAANLLDEGRCRGGDPHAGFLHLGETGGDALDVAQHPPCAEELVVELGRARVDVGLGRPCGEGKDVEGGVRRVVCVAKEEEKDEDEVGEDARGWARGGGCCCARRCRCGDFGARCGGREEAKDGGPGPLEEFVVGLEPDHFLPQGIQAGLLRGRLAVDPFEHPARFPPSLGRRGPLERLLDLVHDLLCRKEDRNVFRGPDGGGDAAEEGLESALLDLVQALARARTLGTIGWAGVGGGVEGILGLGVDRVRAVVGGGVAWPGGSARGQSVAKKCRQEGHLRRTAARTRSERERRGARGDRCTSLGSTA